MPDWDYEASRCVFGFMPGQIPWLISDDAAEIEANYQRVIPLIRDAARKLGYAIGVHGSMKRDLDLIAVPWREEPADRETLVREIQRAACGLNRSRSDYEWEERPCGRWSTVFNIGSKSFIDLSVAPVGGTVNLSSPDRKEPKP